MANIIGEEIPGYVRSQIRARQKLHGSGVNETRSASQMNLLNSNTSWIKLASGVSVSQDKLKSVNLPSSLSGMQLAKDNILYAGTSTLADGKLNQKDGFLPQNPNSSYTHGEFGYSPMPGILSADIKTLNRGSIKKATVKLKIHNKQQFEIIDMLYLRLGYTVLLEWGNSIYTIDGIEKEIVRNTLVEDLFFNIGGNGSYLDILEPIEDKRAKYSGNYDGLLGKISNFDWSFQPDGSYDVTLTIISLGDVVESLKINLSNDKDSNTFLKEVDRLNKIKPNQTPSEGEQPIINEPDPIEENKDANLLTFMLWSWKYINRNRLDPTPDDSITIKTLIEDHNIGKFLNSSEILSTITVEIEFKVVTSEYVHVYGDISEWKHTTNLYTETFVYNNGTDLAYRVQAKKAEYEKNTPNSKVTIKYKPKGTNSTSIPSPIEGAQNNVVFCVNNKTPQYYIQFGYLLEFILNKIIPVIPSTPSPTPLFNIDYETFSNKMYSLPNQISLDPGVCLVRNDSFYVSKGTVTNICSQLLPFKTVDYNEDTTAPNAAYIMNIYLNFNFVIESLNSNSDERGDINLLGILNTICTGLNKSLGGINNLEPIVDEDSNTIKIIDTTPIPNITSPEDKNSSYTLQLYGYNHDARSNYVSNFIRKVDLKTAITPEYATMITVGATAGGYVKGTDATAFSRWNEGLTDRFKEKLIPGNTNSIPESGSIDEAEINYVEKYLVNHYTSRYGWKGNLMDGGIGSTEISTDIVQSNISVVTEYYKYITSKNQVGGGTIGFIPFKLGLTMDGISGMKIYNKIHVNTSFLPSNYGKTLDLIVTGVTHNLSNNDWETNIESTVIPKSQNLLDLNISYDVIEESINKATNSVKQLSKNPDKVCGATSYNNVNKVYPRSKKWMGGSAPVIVESNPPPFTTINLGSQPTVKYVKTIVTPQEYIKAAESVIEKMAPNASKTNKKKILISAFAISRKEQGGPNQGFKGFNNNISGVEASGFQVYSKSDVVGKVILPEGGTGKTKAYYAFKSVDAGLVPLISKIMDRNMFAIGGSKNEWAWRWFRDWNGYGARGTNTYQTNPEYDDCDIISNAESLYSQAETQVNIYSKYR